MCCTSPLFIRYVLSKSTASYKQDESTKEQTCKFLSHRLSIYIIDSRIPEAIRANVISASHINYTPSQHDIAILYVEAELDGDLSFDAQWGPEITHYKEKAHFNDLGCTQ